MPLIRQYLITFSALGVLFAIEIAGCSSDENAVAGAGGFGAKGGRGGSTNDSSAGSAGTGTGGSSAEGGIAIDTGPPGDGALTQDSACFESASEGEVIPLAIYILLDASGSMVQNGSPKWSQAVAAINAFATDPGSAGVKVALQSWSGDGPCDGSVYNTPAIAMDVLPNHAPQISTWLSGISPNGNTPTQGALLGLTTYCGTYAAANPGEKVVGLLVTDGEPTTCDTSAATLTGIAGAAFAATPSILVYAMGMQGADFGLMNQIAQAGGTTSAFDASSGAAAFIAALEAIRGTALNCEFGLPEPDGSKVDPELVNVEFFPTEGGSQKLFKVQDAAACVPLGWYYDDPVNPTKIILCDQTCDMAKADNNGRIEVLLGCKSEPPP
jgi:Mg-chelatase subunit ChlD